MTYATYSTFSVYIKCVHSVCTFSVYIQCVHSVCTLSAGRTESVGGARGPAVRWALNWSVLNVIECIHSTYRETYIYFS